MVARWQGGSKDKSALAIRSGGHRRAGDRRLAHRRLVRPGAGASRSCQHARYARPLPIRCDDLPRSRDAGHGDRHQRTGSRLLPGRDGAGDGFLRALGLQDPGQPGARPLPGLHRCGGRLPRGRALQIQALGRNLPAAADRRFQRQPEGLQGAGRATLNRRARPSSTRRPASGARPVGGMPARLP
ncbi:hypothetical protein VARIO8X_60048 [Burkholderiales bacterium 8X]|nr:hypothetical protein VARIO8X_60048 [Burkholderiales bacterium 8X]